MHSVGGMMLTAGGVPNHAKLPERGQERGRKAGVMILRLPKLISLERVQIRKENCDILRILHEEKLFPTQA